MAETLVKVASASGNAAVQDYLDFLLQDANRQLAEAPAETLSEAPVVLQRESVEAFATEDPDRTESERPEWAEGSFACLSFRVRGLSLAAPLIHLGGILRIEDRLRPLSAQAEWFMGMLRWNGQNIRVVDTARLLASESETSAVEGSDSSRGYDSVVIINDSNWGLAIDSDAESVALSADDIRWRVRRGSRPWMAGVASGSLCSVLEISAVIRLLDRHGEIGLEVADSDGDDEKSGLSDHDSAIQ